MTLSATHSPNAPPAHLAEHNHIDCIHRALSTAQQLCTQRGLQLTPIRQQVLTLIWSSHQAVKAYELLERIKPMQTTAKPATIYRALDFLIAQGFIHRVESLNAFVGCYCAERSHEQLLLICKSCGQVEERAASAVMQALLSEFSQAGFTVHSKAIEIHGLCAPCGVAHSS